MPDIMDATVAANINDRIENLPNVKLFNIL